MITRRRIVRLISILLVLLQIFSIVTIAAPIDDAEGNQFSTSLDGDINGDGIVDGSDLEALSAHVAKVEQIEDGSMLANADVNGDGEISAADMTVLSGMCTVDSDLRLAKVSVDKETADVGSEFEWSAQAFGGEGQIQYAFELFKMDAVAAVSDLDQGQDSASKTMVASQDYSTENSFRVKLDEGGLYAATIYCMDEQGTVCEWPYASPVIVKNTSFDGIKVNAAAGTYAVPGMSVSWNVICQGGNTPFTYHYTLYHNNTEIDSVQTGTPSYSVESCTEGQYFLKVVCTDADGRVQNAASETVFVTSESISAPVLILANSAYSLSATEASAMEIPADALQLQWEAVESAEYYGLNIEKKTESGWRSIADVNAIRCDYTISADLLNMLPAGTLCRVTAWSQGSGSSDEVSYYFKVKGSTAGEEVEVPELTIDGETALTWTVASAENTSRTFVVSPKSGWEVSANEAWILVTPNDNGFWTVLKQNEGDIRTGTITVTYGSQTATITVEQGSASEPPVLVYPEYSQDPSAPTEVPVGGMILQFENNNAKYVGIRIYEQNVDQEQCIYENLVSYKDDWVQVLTDYTFKVNVDYIVELTGYPTDNSSDEEDMLKSRYYIRMTNSDHMLLINGSTAVKKTVLNTFEVKMYSTGAWSWSSDADWLKPEDYLYINYEKEIQKVSIQLEPNYTENARIGTITFFCGEKTATLTVTQDSWLPRFISPTNMSKDMNNPSSLPLENWLENAIFERCTFASYENGVWSEEKVWYESTEKISWVDGIIAGSSLKSNVLYRFTASSGEHTAAYYAKFTTSKTVKYIALAEDTYDRRVDLQWDMTAGAMSKKVKIYSSNAWKASSNASWLTVSSTSGSTASGTPLTISAKANTSGKERTGVISFKIGSEVYATVTVVQAAQDVIQLFVANDTFEYRLYNQETSLKNLDGNGESVDLVLLANGPCDTRSSVSWITASQDEITLKKNTTGVARTGTCTFTCGTASITVTVTQTAQLKTPVITTPTLSDSSKNPSILQYGDLAITWSAVEGAVKYRISIVPEDISLKIDSFQSYEVYVDSTGSEVYSCTIPHTAFTLNGAKYDYVRLFAYDQWGHYSYEYYYFAMSAKDVARLNGSVTPVWDNATDIAAAQDFVVHSTGNWTASTGAEWISLGSTSGADGDTLKVSLTENTGAARTGEVYVRVGTATTVLTVNQCAYLPEYPSFVEPLFSGDLTAPTMIDADTTLVRVAWNYEPQIAQYELRLTVFSRENVMKVLKRVSCKGVGEYTFENLELTPGMLYSITLVRGSHWGATAASCYFMPMQENAYIQVDNKEFVEKELDCDEDGTYVKIDSSSMWTAVTSEDWLLLDDSYVGQEDLDREKLSQSDFASFSGLPGNMLYITALENKTNSFRNGTVTIRCGGQEALVKIRQEPYYNLAELISPQISGSSKEEITLPYGAVVLRWTESAGSVGNYSVSLYERDGDNERSYTKFFSKTDITSNSYTLSEDLFEEGKYYKVFLETDINGMEGGYGHAYYFRMGHENELTVSADVDWSNVSANGSVTVRASASGGAGSYLYAYELLKDGSQVDITELGKWDSYGFSINEPGTYQIKVFCRDAQNFSAQSYSGTYTYGEDRFDSVSLSQTSWKVGAAGGSQSVSVSANGNWFVESCPSWITCSRTEGSGNTSLTLSANKNTSTQRTGTVTFVSGDARTAIHVTQESAVLKTSITYPVKDSSVSVSDLAIVWTAVAEADSYLLSVRDLTTDLLLLNQMSTNETDYTLSGSSLAENHSYRVAVGVVVGGQTWWTESTFITKVDKGPADMGTEDSGPESETPVQHNYTRVNVGTPKLINQSLEIHDVLTTYYEICSICGDKTAEKTEAISTPHMYSSTNRYEAAHPHKLFQRCECGAVKYLDGQFKTGNGTVQESATCCICHGHSFDTTNPKEVNGKWRAYCTKCGNYKTVEAPQSGSSENCTHPYGFPGRKTITVADEVTNVNEKYFHMRRTERKSGDCCGCGAMNPSSVSTSVYSVQEPHIFSSGSSVCSICGYQSATGGFEYTERYILYVSSKYYVGDYVYAGIGEYLSVHIYDTFEGKTYQDGTGDNIEIVLVDPDGIAKLENNVFVAHDSGKCDVVLTYYGKKVDTLPIGVTVLSVKDTFAKYNIDSSGVVRIDDLNGINWKSANVRVTPGVAIGDYSAVQNSNASYTVRFKAYNRSAEVIGFQVFDDEGNRHGTQTAIVKAHWGTGSFIGSMVDTFKQTAQIWNSKSYDQDAEVTDVVLTVPEGGYIQVVDMMDDNIVAAANICEFIIGTVNLKEDAEGLVNPSDLRAMGQIVDYLGRDKLFSAIQQYLKIAKIDFGDFIQMIDSECGMEYAIRMFFSQGFLEAIVEDIPASVLGTIFDKGEDVGLWLLNPGFYYVKHGLQISYTSVGLKELTDAYNRSRSGRTERYVGHIIVPHRDAFIIPNKDSGGIGYSSTNLLQLMETSTDIVATDSTSTDKEIPVLLASQMDNVHISVPQGADVGDTIELQLLTNDMTVASFTCGVEFDPEVLSVVSVAEDPTIAAADGGTWNAIAASAPEQANENGTVGFAFANSEERTYTGSTMATITFEVLKAGSTEIVLYEDSDGLNGQRSDAVDSIVCTFGGAGANPEEVEITLDEQTDEYATITVTNCSNGELAADLVTAAYDANGKMVGYKLTQSVFCPDEPVTATVTYSSPADKIKAFLLDPATKRPLSPAWDLTKTFVE